MMPSSFVKRTPEQSHRCQSGLTLAEIVAALGILTIAVITMVSYFATIHRAAREGKNQGIATMQARTILEKLRDSPSAFAVAKTSEGYRETHEELLLENETDPEKNEVGRKSAMVFEGEGKAVLVAGEIYSLVVIVRWTEEGRQRNVVLESRTQEPSF